jgi:hypothetical protein
VVSKAVKVASRAVASRSQVSSSRSPERAASKVANKADNRTSVKHYNSVRIHSPGSPGAFYLEKCPRERSEAIDRLPNEPYYAGSGIALFSTFLENSFDLAFRILHTFEAATENS